LTVGRLITIRTADADFHAQQQGGQPRAVFIHGFGDDLSTWDGVWEALGESLPALRYDLRGFGRSVPRGQTPYTHADDLVALLDAAMIEQCDLVAVSMGGGIALNFALDHFERVRSLFLISPGLIGWEWSDEWQNLWRPIVEHASNGELDQARQLWWRHPLFSSTRSTASGQSLFESIARFQGTQWVGDLHRRVLPDVERLYQLKSRTMLMTGGLDFGDFRLIADIIESTAGNLERCHYPELGHLIHLEDPRACARKILSFI
jgi:2-succinyl-6-hydroxy-2,4-cyclohexadiene-1-carboxylate synthase